jgi:hypothetical protein
MRKESDFGIGLKSKKPAPEGLVSGLSIPIRIVDDHILVRGIDDSRFASKMLDRQQYVPGKDAIADKIRAGGEQCQ